mmetsp:Transcript_8627/g.20151  ORF Transcript_8627/g.20151 Transcript_8627/m.20151 type:complete len:209 (+) Transcript_8627:2042-2668(+)
MNVILFCDFHLVGADVHCAGWLRVLGFAIHTQNLGIRWTERLEKEALAVLSVRPAPRAGDERAESYVRGLLVGLVGRIELEHGEILRRKPETGDGLTAVYVEGPDGLAEYPSNAWQEVGYRRARVEVMQDVSAVFVEKHGIELGLAQLLLGLGVVFLEGWYVLGDGRVVVAQHHEGKEEDQGPADRVLLPCRLSVFTCRGVLSVTEAG